MQVRDYEKYLLWKSPYVDKTVFMLRRGPDLQYHGNRRGEQ